MGGSFSQWFLRRGYFPTIQSGRLFQHVQNVLRAKDPATLRLALLLWKTLIHFSTVGLKRKAQRRVSHTLPKMAISRILSPMLTQTLNVNLTAELRRYIKEQVRSGRYQNENEVVRDAVRQMQEREFEQFERVFGDYPDAPRGEPTEEVDAAMKAAIKRHRSRRSTTPAA